MILSIGDFLDFFYLRVVLVVVNKLMRRHVLFLLAAILTVVCSCKKEPQEPKEIPIQKITINNGEDIIVEEYSEAELIATIEPANATESINWAISDGKIFYFAEEDGLRAVIHAVYMAQVKDFTAQIWAVSEGGVMSNVITATNHPHKDELTSLTLQYAQTSVKQGGSTYIGVMKYDPVVSFLEMGDIVWTSDDPSKVQIEAVDEKTAKVTASPGTAGSRVDIHATCGKATYKCTIVVISDVVEVTGLTVNSTRASILEDETATFTVTVQPSDATDKSVAWTLSNNGIVTKQAYSYTSCTVKGLKPGTSTLTATTNNGKTATFKITVLQDPVPTDAVDLGYRINDRAVYWSTKNVGAKYDVEIGDYFAWGDPDVYYMSVRPLSFKTGKEGGYSDKNYKYYDKDGRITKYCNKASMSSSGKADGNLLLEKNDDPAAKILGGRWRSPSLADQVWLLTHCTWKETTRNSIPGYIVTSTVEGFEGNSMFLPYTGYIANDEVVADGTIEYFNGEYKKIGTYQTSHLDLTDPTKRAVLVFFMGDIETRYYSRSIGCVIRPVSSRQ